MAMAAPFPKMLIMYFHLGAHSSFFEKSQKAEDISVAANIAMQAASTPNTT